MSIYLKGKGASLADEKKGVPNGGTGKSGVSLGDESSRKVISETNSKVGKRSSFKSFIK